jgi:hypothetical protein
VSHRRSLQLPVAILVMLSIAGCGGANPAFSAGGVSPNALLGHGGDARRFKPGHLYIEKTGFYSPSKIYRYPLDDNGLPSKTPDGSLTLRNPNPGGIAIGPDGDLYVASSGNANGCKNVKHCFVEVFAPLASHQAKPIRVLYVPQRPLWLALDQQGYLDVGTLDRNGRVTVVYAPNAQGHDAPIKQYFTPGVASVAASNGIVYIQTLQLGNAIEALPEHSQSKGPVYYSYGYNFSGNGLAIEGAYLYAQFFWPQGYNYLLATAVFRIDTPGSQIRTIVGTGCKVSRNGGALGYGLAAYKNYIYEGCILGGGANGTVLVYDSTGNGKEKPVMTLPDGFIGVAIGP